MRVAGVVDRADVPYLHAMTTELWLRRPTADFPIETLTLTQAGVFFAPLIGGAASWCGDPYPHVVLHRGIHYLEDGHHRLMRALLLGEASLPARWVTAEDRPRRTAA